MEVTKLCLISLIGLIGCSGVMHQKGFDDVQLLVKERLDKSIEWNEDDRLTYEATQRMQSILSDALTSETSVELALLNNAGLQANFADLGLAQADLIKSSRVSNPVFDGELKLRHGDVITTELSLTESILGLVYVPLRRKIGEEAFELTKLSVAAAVVDLASDTRRAFYSHQGDLQELELRRSVLQALEAAYDLAKRIHEAGNATLLQRDVERAQFEQAKLDLFAAEARALQSRERLSALMGVWGPAADWTADSRLPEVESEAISFAGVEETAVERSLDLASAKRQISLAAARGAGARGQTLLDDGEAGIAAEREDGEWFGGPSLSIPIPIFDLGGAAAYRAKTEVAQTKSAFRDLAVQVRARAREAYVETESLRQQAMYQKAVMIPLRQRIVAETQKEYNAMLIGAFDLFRAKRDEIETGVEYVRSLHDYWMSRSDMWQINNGRLPVERRPRATSKEGAAEEAAKH